MKSKIKRILLAGVRCATPAFLLLNLLAMILVLVNLIPNSAIYDNLCKSIDYYKSMESFTKIGAEPGADLNQLNIIMQVDSKHPLKSAMLDAIYGKTGQFRDDLNGYQSILGREKADHEYSRYWHGSQILWRPLLTVLTARQIMLLCYGVYTILFMILMFRLGKQQQIPLAVGLIVIHTVWLIPNVFRVLNFIPVFLITVGAMLALCSDRVKPVVVFGVTGMLTAFFDFLTIETIALTFPLLLIVCREQKAGTLKILNCAKYGALWLFCYCFTFLYKWLLASVILGKNYFAVAIREATKYKCDYGRLMSVKINVNAMMFGKVSYNASFAILFYTVMALILFLYFFRKPGTEKFLFCVLIVCLIPYLRYFVMDGHSWEHAYMEFRAQLVIVPAILVAVCVGLRGMLKGGAKCQK